MGRQQGIAGHCWPHLAIAENEVGEDREHGFARGALDTPDGQTTQPDPHIMRVTRQAPSTTTGCLVGELKAKGQEKGEHELEKRLAIVKQLKVRRFMLKIDGNGPVFSRRFGCCAHVSPLGHQVSQADETRWREQAEIARQS